MALVLKKLIKFWDILDDYMGDPRVEDYFLMQTPLQLTGVIALYLFIIFKGPKFMKNRQPFDLRNVLIVYNLFQIILNTVMFYKSARLYPIHSFSCAPPSEPNNPNENLEIDLHMGYTQLKLLDLLDTIFYVLRKKYNQISYLHVHHHIGILIAAWISGKYFPGGQAYFVALPNTFVHIIMYTYYFMTSWNSNQNTKNIWWKKYITQLQIVQQCYILIAVFPSMINVHCSYPKGWMALFSANVLLITYLFCKFYIRTYLKLNSDSTVMSKKSGTSKF